MRVTMCSFYLSDVYYRHNYLLKSRQKLHLFSDIYFCMDIMMGMHKEDFSAACFGSAWSRATNRKADTSIERARQSKW